METTKKTRKVLTPAEKIKKLEKAVERYSRLLTKAQEDLAKLKAKENKAEITALVTDLLSSGKSIDEIKALLG